VTRWRKVKPVAVFELLCTIRSKGWLITTLGMPVFVLAYGAIVSVPIYLEARSAKQVAVYGIVDDAGILGLAERITVQPIEIPAEIRSALEATGRGDVLDRHVAWNRNFVFSPFPTEERARDALATATIRGYYRLPPDYLASGVVESYVPETRTLRGGEARRALDRLLVMQLVRGRVGEDLAARISEPISETRDWVVTKSGEVQRTEDAAKMVRIFVPLGFAVLLVISILMSAGGLIQSTAIEKENKVVEVLLSSANPDEILLGKLFGQGIAGTLQMTVWLGMAAVAGIGFASALAAMGVEPPWLGMAAVVLFFPLAYLLFGSLMLGTGSLGSNQKEANQWGMAWALLAAVPMVMLEPLLNEPHGLAARILTWLPFASPTVVVLRLTIDPQGIAWWEVLGALAVLIAGIWFTIRLSARLFRVGIMLTGARPKLSEILRQARLRP
jgi:ABC-2 type transport system permease protein